MDCSTIDVASARAVGEQATAKGFAFVDAPVSGGIAAANAGTLTFMVGGEDAAFAKAQPILSQMGKAVIHAGALGAGQAAKICNNMLLGATMIATRSEEHTSELQSLIRISYAVFCFKKKTSITSLHFIL